VYENGEWLVISSNTLKIWYKSNSDRGKASSDKWEAGTIF
jgi:hypothetical protein